MRRNAKGEVVSTNSVYHSKKDIYILDIYNVSDIPFNAFDLDSETGTAKLHLSNKRQREEISVALHFAFPEFQYDALLLSKKWQIKRQGAKCTMMHGKFNLDYGIHYDFLRTRSGCEEIESLSLRKAMTGWIVTLNGEKFAGQEIEVYDGFPAIQFGGYWLYTSEE